MDPAPPDGLTEAEKKEPGAFLEKTSMCRTFEDPFQGLMGV